MLTRENWRGPWAGLPVAWTDAGEFDEQTYRADVARCCQAGIPGVYTGGTSGEFYAQEFEEFQQIANATVDVCHRNNTPAMIGCTATFTRGAIRRVKFASEIGADAIQIALPFWMEVADDEVLPFFCTVADAAADLPLSIYETGRSKKRLTVEQHLQISAVIPQYLMVKATAGTVGDTMEGCRLLSAAINVFVGEHRWAELGPHGAAGSCSSMVYWNPSVILKSWSLVGECNWPRLQGDCQKMAMLFESIFARFDKRGFTDTAYDRLGGLATGFLKTSLHNRGPYTSPKAVDLHTMREILRETYPEFIDVKCISNNC